MKVAVTSQNRKEVTERAVLWVAGELSPATPPDGGGEHGCADCD
ncbi:MAG TPA: hypothetical protein VKA17_06895 [Gammaproteobacteria bacterium]|nr:hypothetical protein [Gammaproteobacteria bacterium]